MVGGGGTLKPPRQPCSRTTSAAGVLPFDGAAAAHYALILAERRRSGRVIAMADGMIAAITRAHTAPLVTRNTRDFDSLDLRLVDPWQDPGRGPSGGAT